LIECNSYSSSLPYSDRFDYVETITQELLLVNALERLIGCVGYIYPSTRRTLSLEFYRIPNHCLFPSHSTIQSAQTSYKVGLFLGRIEQPGQTIPRGPVFLVLQINEFLYSYLSIPDRMIGSLFYSTPSPNNNINNVILLFNFPPIILILAFLLNMLIV
jgi:hypothetical protein